MGKSDNRAIYLRGYQLDAAARSTERRMIMAENVCVTVSNYATEALPNTLNFYGKAGFSLVSTQMASDKYGNQVLYLFFVRHTVANRQSQK